MSQLIINLFEELDNMSHCTDESALKRILLSWTDGVKVSLVRESIHQWLTGTAEIDQLKMAARETTTHYIWPLYVSTSGHSLVINEFKDPQQMTPGHASTLHNHRYSFASLVLSGGYRQVRCDVEIPEYGVAARVHDLGQDKVAEGNILAVSYHEFHRLTDISRRTVTLLAKCPPAKEDSISVDIETLSVSRHVPVEARVVQLMNALVA